MDKKLRISIVIPVYNEAEHLVACLRAIAQQTFRPYEVIVVDNNSSDSTAQIAERFPFVKLLREPRQGVIYARTRGFNASRGEIIARIDGDSVIPPDWLASVNRIFTTSSVAAVSGAPHYYDFIFPTIADGIDHFMRARLARQLGNTNFLYGANMALRRSAWLAARPRLCHKKGIHEDFDLAIHLQELGYSVEYDAQLIASVSARRINDSFENYARYTLVSPRTYAAHNLKSRRHMYPVVLVCWLCHPPGRLLSRGFSPETGTFSWLKLLFSTPAAPRVDPTVNVA